MSQSGQGTPLPKNYTLPQFSAVQTAVCTALAQIVPNFDSKDLLRALHKNNERLEYLLRLALDSLITHQEFGKPGYLPPASYIIKRTWSGGGPRDQWQLVKDVSESNDVSIDDLELVHVLEEGESFIDHDEWQRRATKLGGNFGFKVAEALYEERFQFPKEWRGFWINFPSTIWKDCNGDLRMMAIHYAGGIWFKEFVVLEINMVDDDAVLRLRAK
jgi:hypothetical protein